MQNKAELIANKQHNQMLCEASAGVTLIQASTINRNYVFNQLSICSKNAVAGTLL